MRAHVTGINVAVAQPDVLAEPQAGQTCSLRQMRLQSRQRGLHFTRGAHGAFGVVLARQRHAERGQDGVADELVDRAAVLDQHVHHQVEVSVEKAHDLLGRQLLRERGEPTDVAE